MRKLITYCLSALLLSGGISYAEDTTGMDPELQSKAKRAVDAGLHYLRTNQADDGSWSDSVGVTALGLRAFLQSHRGYSEIDGAFITRPVEFVLAHINEDGSISETNQNRNYNTAVAMTGLAATSNDDHADVLAGAQAFLKGLQK